MATTKRFGSLNIITGKDGQVPQYLINGSPVSATEIANRVIVNSASDFPTAVAGVIPLASNTQYYIGTNDVDVGTDRFSFGVSTSLKGAPGASILKSTNAGDLFTGGDAGQFTVQTLSIQAPNARIFNITDTSPSTLVVLIDSIITACDSVGLFTGIFGINITNSAAVNTNDGIETSGAIVAISIRQFQMISASATFKAIDLGSATSPTIEFVDLALTAPAGAFGISGLASSGNVSSGSIASVTSCEFLGGMTALETITVDDIRWRFAGNSGISDTRQFALVSIKGNGTATNIVASSTDGSNAVLMAGTFTCEDQSHFSCTTAGRVTYLGERDLTVNIEVVVTMDPNDDNTVAPYIALNGTAIDSTGLGQFVKANDPQTLPVIWELTLSMNDFVEIHLENQTGTTDITGNNGILKVG